MRYVDVPRELAISEIRAFGACFSPGRYIRFCPPKAKGRTDFVPLDQLLVLREEHAKVVAGGTYRYAEIGDVNVATGGVVFRSMRGFQVPSNRPLVAQHGDVLVSTVRTYRKGIGWVDDSGDDLVTTTAFMNICGVKGAHAHVTKEYVYAFLRSDFFVEQVWSMLNRGLYPRMDKGALDKVVLPVASDEKAVKYVSALVTAIIDKEAEIRRRSALIQSIIDGELASGQKAHRFEFEFPGVDEVRQRGRLDACIYDREFKSKMWLIENYASGSRTPAEAGFTVTPGPSLEIKLLRTRVDSDVPRPGFYALILPTHISEYGTMDALPYIGTPRRLPVLREGDVVFGEAGFQKGRSIVLLEGIDNCTTNAHGLVARRSDDNIAESVFFRCIFNWYRSMRLIDLLAVGGSGGHFSPEYFELLRIPQFPDPVRESIVSAYHSDGQRPTGLLGLANFAEWHREWNHGLGIWQLAREMKELQRELSSVQETIISGEQVLVPVA